ncbi:hypothetical protein HNQ46_000816 [Oribacterium sinus]|uniref:Uncharacterized protein n=1 Tax=Oribacterium sinus TaxID=237576 RepID=A0A7W9SET7_9FIRM|nr:hypothetical protein [Oribacterium sinus]
MKDIKKDPFDEYIRNLPPTRKELGQAWSTAIGLIGVRLVIISFLGYL